jgi:hypothetical protein
MEVPVVRALGTPDGVYVDRTIVPRGAVSLVYLARAGVPATASGVGALLTVLPVDDLAPVEKLIAGGIRVRRADVNGAPAYYVEGEHVLSPPERLAASTLIWVRDGATLRLESDLDLAGAVRLARSVG